MSNTSMSHEFVQLSQAFGTDLADMQWLTINAMKSVTTSPSGWHHQQHHQAGLRNLVAEQSEIDMTVTVTEVDHPIVNDALARMRSVETSNANFRAHLNRLGIILLAEATKPANTFAEDHYPTHRNPTPSLRYRWSFQFFVLDSDLSHRYIMCSMMQISASSE